MNADIFIPVRLGSSRLPEKHFRKIDGQPVIKYLIERLKSTKKIRNIIVCTTNLKSDDPLIEFLEKEDILYYRGSSKDILVRFLDASKQFKTDIIVDVEGDKIYTDPVFVDKIVEKMSNSDIDYIEGKSSNENKEPVHGIHGVVPAGIRVSILKKICNLKKTNNTETGYREFFINNEIVKCGFLLLDSEIKFPENIRLTLDYPEDLELAKNVFKELGNNFHLLDILNLFNKKPELLKITEPLIKKWEKEYKKNLTNFTLTKK